MPVKSYLSIVVQAEGNWSGIGAQLEKSDKVDISFIEASDYIMCRNTELCDIIFTSLLFKNQDRETVYVHTIMCMVDCKRGKLIRSMLVNR